MSTLAFHSKLSVQLVFSSLDSELAVRVFLTAMGEARPTIQAYFKHISSSLFQGLRNGEFYTFLRKVRRL